LTIYLRNYLLYVLVCWSCSWFAGQVGRVQIQTVQRVLCVPQRQLCQGLS